VTLTKPDSWHLGASQLQYSTICDYCHVVRTEFTFLEHAQTHAQCWHHSYRFAFGYALFQHLFSQPPRGVYPQ